MDQVIPLNDSPNQSFSSTLSVDGSPLTLGFIFRYNEIALYWAMSVYDQNGNLLLDSIPLVTGNDPACNILGQFAYLGIGSGFVLNISGTFLHNYPDNTDLGTDFILVWDNTPIIKINVGVVGVTVGPAPPPTVNSLTIPSTSLPWPSSDPAVNYYYTGGGIPGPLIPCAPGQKVTFAYVSGTIAAGGAPVTGAGAGAGTTGGVHPWPSDRLTGGFTTGSAGECCGAWMNSLGFVLGVIRIDSGVTTTPAPPGTVNISVGVNLVGGGWGISTGSWQYTWQYTP